MLPRHFFTLFSNSNLNKLSLKIDATSFPAIFLWQMATTFSPITVMDIVTVAIKFLVTDL